MKRRLVLLLLLLLGGAIVNVAVAWGDARLSETSDWTFHSPYSTEQSLGGSRFGWPTKSVTNDPAPVFASPRRYAIRGDDVQLPYLPIWPGFAINTVFYAGLLWLLFAAPFALRRWRRIRRGLCPKCAYDLRGTTAQVCPECGAQK